MSEALENLEHIFPDLPLLRHGLSTQQVGRMIGCHDRDGAKQMPAAAHVLHGLDFPEEATHRGCAQSNHYLRPNKLDLLPEIRQTSLHLLRRWLPISRCPGGYIWTAFQHVCNV